MNLKLPKLQREEKIGHAAKKNIIIHLIQEETDKELEILSFQRGKVVLKDLDNNEYYITTDKNDIPDDKNFVLLSKSFLKADVEIGNIRFVKWLKHPDDIENLSRNVVNSWKN